ncbi:MAG: sialate O-acetylesterase [Verrucomicrobiales bacterium]|jgi:sialate O-acetylesterase|nr:sialate O-acetylesterase [Verrucomicrobiales bacterium]
MQRLILLLAAGLSLAAVARADVKLPAIFGDHMVLQQDIKIPVWGQADPGEEVTVSFAGQTLKTKAADDGKWRVNLEKIATNSVGQTLTVTGNNQVKFDDVVVGEVWIGSGQSNMEFTLTNAHNAATEIPAANDQLLRLYLVERQRSPRPLGDLQKPSAWQVCTPDSARGFSAVAYFFAKELRGHLQRPVGMIAASWGGSGCESWISQDVVFNLDASGKQWQREFEDYLATYDQRAAAYPALKEKYDADLKQWQTEVEQSEDFKAQNKAWYLAATQARKENQADPPRPVPARPRPVEPRDPAAEVRVGFLFNGMIAPLIPYAIRGAIWYQGESNVGGAHRYLMTSTALIKDWRARWSEGDFPFLFVQLANHKMPVNELLQTANDWPRLREAQLQTLAALPNTGMATAIDLGDAIDIHPRDKADVGHRLALAARKIAYGENLVDSGPLYKSMQIDGNKIRVTFSDLGSGLAIGVPPWVSKGEIPPVADELQGFAIAGADKKFVWAKARIEGDAVIVWSDEVPAPVAVRYGWANNPVLNLYNKEKLPASPFRTDKWE